MPELPRRLNYLCAWYVGGKNDHSAILKVSSVVRADAKLPDSLLERGQQVYARLYNLVVNPGYRHPDDMVLAAYIFLIGRLPNPVIREFINEVANSGRQEFRSAVAVAQYFEQIERT